MLFLVGLNLGVILAIRHCAENPLLRHLLPLPACLLAGGVIYILLNWSPKQ